jgi:hypothetical protein
MAVSLVLALGVGGCGTVEKPAAAPHSRDARTAPAAPNVLELSCSRSGTAVSGSQVAARRDGVHVRITNRYPSSDVYLAYRYASATGPGGGSRVAAGTSTQILYAPPGPLWLTCSPDPDRNDDQSVVTVVDPQRAWRSGALARYDCRPPWHSGVDWVYPFGHGRTAEAALRAVTARQPGTSTWTWRMAQEGYVEAARQTYVLWRDGHAWVSAEVTRSRRDAYTAALGTPCEPWPRPSATDRPARA